MQDSELLRDYVENGSEAAFARLVSRYINLVYGTAQRLVRDGHQAEEIAQSVFCLLAQKAGSFTGELTLAGWLYQTTRFTAAKAFRTEQRRRQREQEAAAMNDTHVSGETNWETIAPHLDGALEKLNDKDRLALLLRFFQQKSMREVGESMGVTEAAAKMRVGRAVDQVRQILSKQGVTCSITLLTAILSQKGAEAAPAALTLKVTTAALTGATVAVPLLTSLGLLCRLKAKAILACGAGCAVLMLLIGHFYFSESKPAVDSTPSATSRKAPNIRETADFARQRASRATDAELAEFADLIARLRAALHNPDTHPRTGIPVLEAVKAFHPHMHVAFKVLKEEAETYDHSLPSSSDEDTVPGRAVHGMGALGKGVPEAVTFLWQFYDSSTRGAGTLRYSALYALHAIGFEPSDIPLLVDRVLKNTNKTELVGYPPTIDGKQPTGQEGGGFEKSQAASWIAEIISNSGAAAEPYLFSVRNALRDPDPGVRFWAACALVKHEGATNPRVLAEINTALETIQSEDLSWASDIIFKESGPVLKPIVPALLKAGRAASEKSTREWTLLAAGYIDPEVRSEAADVDAVMAKDEKDKAELALVNSGKATVDDLVLMLEERESKVMAAQVLGEMGPAAAKALPAMVEALKTIREAGAYGEVLKSIEKVDPKVAAEHAPIELEVLNEGLQYAMKELSEIEREKVMTVIMENYQPTRHGIISITQTISAQNKAAGRAFANALIARDPTFAPSLQKVLE